MAKHRRPRVPLRQKTGLARRLTGASVLVAGGIVVALTAAGGTYAMWNRVDTLESASITSGNIGLTINNLATAPITGLTTTKLLPGRSVITATPLTVKNTGIVPVSVSPGSVVYANPSSALASQLVVAVRQLATCTVTTPVGTAPVSSAPFILLPGQSTTVCVEVQLKATAPASVQGLSLAFTVPLAAAQVRL